MVRFVLKRLLIAIPVLFIVTVLAFFMAEVAPGDPVEALIAVEQSKASANVPYDRWIDDYRRQASRMGYDMPPFYFSLTPSNRPDTLHRIIYKPERQAANRMLNRYGEWSKVQDYQLALRQIAASESRVSSDQTQREKVINDARYLLLLADGDRVNYLWREIDSALPDLDNDLARSVRKAQAAREAMLDSRKLSGVFPAFVWHGPSNRYHRWITGMLQGDFGISIVDGRKVGQKVFESIGWTLRINGIAILLAFGIAVPLGLYLGRNAGKRSDRAISSLLFIFFAIPSFWLATLLIVFFTTPEYSEWLDLFPSGGLGNYHYASGWQKFGIMVSSLVLPVTCLLLGALAYLTRQMRGNVVREASKDYVRMARAKGLTEKQVYRRHILRNALFPIFTLVGAAIPASISGSVIIEVVFNIPGMGMLLYQSILAQDWSVVFTMVVLASVLTIVGYIISDVLYMLFDPRIRTQRALA